MHGQSLTATRLLEKYHKLQPNSETTDELKVVCMTIWEELSQDNITEAVHGKLHQALARLLMADTWNICSKSLFVFKSASSSQCEFCLLLIALCPQTEQTIA